MFLSGKVYKKAQLHIASLTSSDKLPATARFGDDSKYYLVKLKYNGIQKVEMFGLTSVGNKALRNFGWVLLEFSDYGIGGRGGIISLSRKSKELNGDQALYSTYIPRWGVQTNVENYTPLTKYENALVIQKTTDVLVIKDCANGDEWFIKRGDKKDDFLKLAKHIDHQKDVQCKDNKK